jgi:hypothetical protein
MKSVRFAVAAIALAAASVVSAQTTLFTERTSFNAVLAPGSYTETFSDSSIDQAASANFSGGAFSFTVSPPGTVL